MAASTPTAPSVETYLHHTLVRVEFAELLFDLLHPLLHALLLPQQALLRGDKRTRRRKEERKKEKKVLSFRKL